MQFAISFRANVLEFGSLLELFFRSVTVIKRQISLAQSLNMRPHALSVFDCQHLLQIVLLCKPQKRRELKKKKKVVEKLLTA